jgi:phosphoribosylamine---glycine ligase
MHDYDSVLIVGSGGREHALGWKISQNDNVKKVIYANGNGGTHHNIQILPTEIDKLAQYAKENKLFTVVGPEVPLSLGIVDMFNSFDLPIFGPTRGAARLETSKEFSKQFMNRHSIPTSEFKVFTDADKAVDYIERINFNAVIKADGLASGKGVFVSNNKTEAMDAIDQLLNKKIFGPASEKIIIERKIDGEEISLIAICDGESFRIMDTCRDHKRVFDDDRGPNTGGMGSYSPVPGVSQDDLDYITNKVFKPAINGMRAEGYPYKGFLYAGMMIEKHSGKPYVLEFNARMGDPECQPLMMRMQSDLFEYIKAAETKSLDSMRPLLWKDKFSTCVIMTSKGYPDKYETGYTIRGLRKSPDGDKTKYPIGGLSKSPDGDEIMIFHSGTKLNQDNDLVTAGGRVLGITSLGKSIHEAMSRSYQIVQEISWGNDQQYFRTDIGKKGLVSDR